MRFTITILTAFSLRQLSFNNASWCKNYKIIVLNRIDILFVIGIFQRCPHLWFIVIFKHEMKSQKSSIITRLLNKTCRPWFKSSKDIYQNLISSSCLWVSKIPFFKLQFLWFLLDKTAEKTNEINQTTMYHGGLKLYQSLLITFLKLISKTLKAVLKYGFCNKSFRKDEPLTSWTLFSTYVFSKLDALSPNVLIRGEKSVQLVRGSFFRNDLLQNSYFKRFLPLDISLLTPDFQFREILFRYRSCME